jgi:amino-acid N-acetyltransferase
MIKIRKVKNESDILQIKKLIDWGARNSRILPRTLEEIRETSKYFYVCEENGEIIGCCSLEIYNRKLSEIRSLVVHPKHQNKGIGSKLVKACLKEAKRKKIYEVLAITDKVKFFEKLGFRKCLNNQCPMFIKLKTNEQSNLPNN